MDQDAVERFFIEYARASFDPDPRKLAGLYAPSFIAAAPEGSAVFANDERFLEWLRAVRAGNEQTGMTALSPARVETKWLSARHRLATVTWAATFEKTGPTPVTFDISYLLEVDNGSLHVLAYVAHTSEVEERRRLGLTAGN